MTNYEKMLTLDVSEPDYSRIVFAKQRDNLSRILTVKILINGTPYAYESGDIAVFRYTRPNKTENRAAATIDPATGYISVVFDNQLLAIEGAIVCDIDISNGGKNLSTPLFIVQNDKSPGKDTQVLTLDEYQILLQAIQEAENVGFDSIYIDEHRHLILELKNGETVDAGIVGSDDEFEDFISAWIESHPEEIETLVGKWLEAHPEATTTLLDGSVTEQKLAEDVLAKFVEIDSTLTESGKAADANEVGELLRALGEQVETDTTLSESGKPADAKATGEKMSSLQATKLYPKLTSAQKTAIRTLINAYVSNRSVFKYDYDATRNTFKDGGCYDSETGKFKMCCATFVEHILMGRSVEDFVGKTASTYSNHITKAFNFGYYPKYILRQKVFGLKGAAADAFYGFTDPNNIYLDTTDFDKVDLSQHSGDAQPLIADSSHSTVKTAVAGGLPYSYNTYYSEAGQNYAHQVFNGFMYANDLAQELYELGCEIPFSELDVGDMVFMRYPQETDWVRERMFWRSIGHVAIVREIDVDGNPVFTECSSTGGSAAVIASSGLNFSGNIDKARNAFIRRNIVMCARFPIAFGIASNVPETITMLAGPV